MQNESACFVSSYEAKKNTYRVHHTVKEVVKSHRHCTILFAAVQRHCIDVVTVVLVFSQEQGRGKQDPQRDSCIESNTESLELEANHVVCSNGRMESKKMNQKTQLPNQRHQEPNLPIKVMLGMYLSNLTRRKIRSIRKYSS